MQSKQNHICALWWFQGFKSLTLEFSVGSSPAVQVASGNLWFSDLAGEWQEEMLLKNICQGCGAQMKLTFLLCYKQTGFSPHGRSFLLSGGGRHLCLCSETCYCCHEQHMRQRVTEGPSSSDLFNSREQRGSWMQRQSGAFRDTLLKTILILTFAV